MICSTCRFNLDRCYKFKQQCKKADEALRAYPISGVLPRPLTINVNDPSEQSNKRNLDTKASNEQAKKARLDNGDRERQPAHQGIPAFFLKLRKTFLLYLLKFKH